MTRHDVDVLVIGAGMIGAAFAAALRDAPLSVALIDAGGPPPSLPQPPYAPRISALSPGSRAILEACGAWPRLDAARIGPYHGMQVWDAASRGAIEFSAADLGAPWLGYIVENSNVHHALLGAIDAADNIDCRFHTTPQGLDVTGDHCRLHLRDQASLSARLVVGADGAGSWLRGELGIAAPTRRYAERAFVCQVRTTLAHGAVARQRFLPSGPLAFLPLANGDCSVVWSADAPLAAELAELDAAALGERLGDAFEHRLGEVELRGPVGGFDLSRRRATRYVVARGALLGDAAHVVHPLAGQGANLGFADAWSLARVLRDAARRERDIGGLHVLRRYERWRRSDNLAMLRMLDVLHGLFASRSAVVRGVRGVGLNLVDRHDGVKRFLAGQALGEKLEGVAPGHES